MPDEHALIAVLQPHDRPLSPDEPMAEAGRVILLRDFMAMLAHEAGAQTGEDIEDVHEMRVATRRMRSALRLLEPYYTGKTARKFRKQLGEIADVLGDIRDRDVLLAHMSEHLAALPADEQTGLREIMRFVETEREDERTDLHQLVSKRRYTRFTEAFQAFLTTPEAAAEPLEDYTPLTPSRVRHVLPAIIYDHLGIVRAYDPVIAEADAPTLHQLRIEFKRLRYTLALFEEVLGSGVKAFLKDLKTVQDLLGRMQDIATAHLLLEPLQGQLDKTQQAALEAYFAALEEERTELLNHVLEYWQRFNTKTVQKQLTTAVAVL